MSSSQFEVSDFFNSIDTLKRNLNNSQILFYLEEEEFNELETLHTTLEVIGKNKDIIQNNEKFQDIKDCITKLVQYTNNKNFDENKFDFIQQALLLISIAPKEIDEIEFSKRYDKLIEILKFDKEEKSNLILETPSDKVPFQLFKNQNNSIIVVTKNGSKNSMTKEKLANIVYRNGSKKKLSYELVIIPKLLDNSIFDLIQDTTINQNTTNIDEQIKNLEAVQYLYLSREEENKQKLEQIIKNEIERQKNFNEVSMMEQQAKNAQTDFQNAQTAVLEKFKLQESFIFWKTQGESYNTQYLLYIAFSLIAIVILLIYTSNFLNNSHLSISSVISCFADNNSTAKAEEIITKKEIWQYGFLILSITLTLWFVRILMKIALSNYHLAVDAKERIVMIRTYLALMQEGKGFEQDDRKVILDNIFRPTNHGIIKDEASITITDILSAIKSK